MSTPFCETCFKSTRYITVEKTREVPVRDKSVKVTYRAPICPTCGGELYDADVECSILLKAKSLYRSKVHMTPATRIRKYMQRYQLTTEQMAERVGCAVTDIILAADDTLLDKATDAKIRNIISA